MPRTLLLSLLGAGAVCAVVPSSALAATASQLVSGTTLSSSLALGSPANAAFGTALGPNATADSTGGTVPVTAVGAWVMRVSGTDSGKLRRTSASTACQDSSSVLTNPLSVFATGGTTTGLFFASSTTLTPQTLTGTAAQVASGTNSNTVTLNYRYSPSSSDAFVAGCDYSLTTTVDLAAN